MSVLRYFLPNGGDILLNFTHIMDFFAEWKAADSENNFLYHLFWFLYYNNQFKMHNNFKQTKIKRTGQSPLKWWSGQSNSVESKCTCQNSSQEYKIHSGPSNRYPPLLHHACPPVCASVWISVIAALAGFPVACPHWVCDLARPPCPPAWCGTLTASEWSCWRTESPPSGRAAQSGRGKRWNCRQCWLPVKCEAWFCQTTNHWARDPILTNLLQNFGT